MAFFYWDSIFDTLSANDIFICVAEEVLFCCINIKPAGCYEWNVCGKNIVIDIEVIFISLYICIIDIVFLNIIRAKSFHCVVESLFSHIPEKKYFFEHISMKKYRRSSKDIYFIFGYETKSMIYCTNMILSINCLIEKCTTIRR